MAGMTQSMQYTMPIMFSFFSLSFPSGLSIYWILSNLIGIGQGYITRANMAKEEARRADEKSVQKAGLADGGAVAVAAKSGGSGGSSNGSKSKAKRKRRSAKR